MKATSYFSASGTLFTIVGVLHAYRALSGGDLVFVGFIIPSWVSAVAAIVLGYLAYSAFKLSGKKK